MKTNITLIILGTLLLISSISACQQKPIQSSETENVLQEKTVLFLTLKAVKTEEGLKTELIEQSVREDNSNPLGTGEPETGDTFRCQILNKKGDVLLSSTRKFEFKYQTEEGDSYAFLKFSESLPDGYAKCIVGAKISEGVWQELYNVKLN